MHLFVLLLIHEVVYKSDYVYCYCVDSYFIVCFVVLFYREEDLGFKDYREHYTRKKNCFDHDHM